MAEQVQAALKSEELIGAPWPSESWQPSILLRVFWTGTKVEATLGNRLTGVSTVEEPTVEFQGEEDKLYTITCIDPDAPARGATQYGFLNHWTQGDLKATSSGVVEKTSPPLVKYAGPSLSKSGHRYAFLLYEQLGGKLEKEQSTIKGEGLMDRVHWNFTKFETENKLKLVGANFFLSKLPEED